MEDNKNQEKISNETAHEIIVAVMERQVKRLFILCLVIFAAFVISNVAWIVYEYTYQDVVVTETTQDGSGVNLIGINGDVDYGTESQGSKN